MSEAISAPVPETWLPPVGPRHMVAAVRTVWLRELILFSRSGLRLVMAFVQPLLFLFVLGTGLSSLVAGGALHGTIGFRTFMYPGVLAFAVLMPSFFSAGSVVWDREFGFLREMLVAPVPRSAIVIGKCLGGATVATGQAAVLLLLVGAVDVPYDPLMLLALLGELFLLSFTLVAGGVAAAARITQFQSFMAVVQLILFPLIFLSGALFPLSGLPAWLAVLTRLDPITYAVDPLRRTVFSTLDLSAATQRIVAPGVTWWGWHVPLALELVIVAGMGLALLALAIWQFRGTE